MARNLSLLMLPGDGIGPEIMNEARRVIDWLRVNCDLDIVVHEGYVGGAAYDAYGVPLSDEALDLAGQVDAILLGAVGGSKWDGVDYDKRPEAGLLTLRKELGLFANLRPAICFKALVDASSLKAELVSGLDIMIVRELTGGVYFGEPRGIEDMPDGERRGVNTQVYTTSEIHRIAHVAFDMAAKRGGRVTSCDKANVMESGLLWREEVTRVAADYPDITLEHMLADSCAMQLVRRPKQFDVIVTDNLFGDLLSDVAAMLTGSLGMLPSAALGVKGGPAMYEPVHGSAPDIAGQGIANPIATILSLAMALRYSFDCSREAQMIEDAVENVLAGGLRTADIMQPGKAKVSTIVMGDSILRALDSLNKK